MKNILVYASLFSALYSPISAYADTGIGEQKQKEELTQQAKLKMKAFASQLKTELLAAIQTGGLEAGVEVCHSKAPKIAQSLSTDNWTVARTSLKTRNLQNKPDQWESDSLALFDKNYKEGVKAADLVVSSLEEDRFRLMKAIPMDNVCLACHGSNIDPKLQKTIQKYYPEDRAIGFSMEDIRGAFTLQKDLSQNAE
ncbi:DUF3365 domain-containing protein [Glaciecola sp. MF2-115]|uniref:Tll0287-like domain-containing protein n=1 Tax=Glaciecola sp. MF2-115 TaxID=3384827 RepID=UPI0039A11ED9